LSLLSISRAYVTTPKSCFSLRQSGSYYLNVASFFALRAKKLATKM
jgi:hypothetical protein